MSRKTWNVKFVAGNPEIFTEVRTASGSPFTRLGAKEAFEIVANHGWRAWIEHAETQERIAETDAEKEYRAH